jgi:hypothetical protein
MHLMATVSHRDMPPDILSRLVANLPRDGRSLAPPGTVETFVDHPAEWWHNKRAVSIGIVMEHRFAFYFWLKCKQNLLRRSGSTDENFCPPDLVSMDWHDDFGTDSDVRPDELSILNQSEDAEVAMYCWAGLHPLDDGQIFPALWLNAIGNVYIVQRQHQACKAHHRVHVDRYGKPHEVYYFRHPRYFPDVYYRTRTTNGVIWDVDLDYFTRTKVVPDRMYAPPVPDREIAKLLAPRSEWMRLILRELHAITIALEPRYTGGLGQTFKFFDKWERSLFVRSIFSDACRWKTSYVQRWQDLDPLIP